MQADYHIMSSCDSNLVKYIPVQLYSLFKNQTSSTMDYYLLHRNIEAEKLDFLKISAIIWVIFNFIQSEYLNLRNTILLHSTEEVAAGVEKHIFLCAHICCYQIALTGYYT